MTLDTTRRNLHNVDEDENIVIVSVASYVPLDDDAFVEEERRGKRKNEMEINVEGGPPDWKELQINGDCSVTQTIFNSVNYMLGSIIFSAPYVIRRAGMYGFALFGFLLFGSWFTARAIDRIMEKYPDIKSFGCIARKAFGVKGEVFVCAAQIGELFGYGASCLVTAAILCEDFAPRGSILQNKSLLTIIFALVTTPTMWFKSLKGTALLSTFGISVFVAALGFLVVDSIQSDDDHQSYSFTNPAPFPPPGTVSDDPSRPRRYEYVFSTVGLVFCVFSTHAVLPDLRTSMIRPNEGNFRTVVDVTYVTCGTSFNLRVLLSNKRRLFPRRRIRMNSTHIVTIVRHNSPRLDVHRVRGIFLRLRSTIRAVSRLLHRLWCIHVRRARHVSHQSIRQVLVVPYTCLEGYRACLESDDLAVRPMSSNGVERPCVDRRAGGQRLCHYRLPHRHGLLRHSMRDISLVKRGRATPSPRRQHESTLRHRVHLVCIDRTRLEHTEPLRYR